ncbi:amino acid/polyamine/organocation transporter (APC superfamily) [Dongia mobilis]|uniref:Amino acid/polyamine/organocation transporter (APC superfamily) n=1 Tax=Dongia mobilis TaxID=578943 RepID=A0A4R6WSM0_9PROT|nr:APC family permease [Dongia mobilis]TDQ83008.1 amino acid/polyamine/organocation transporter (APC superfamily) [Dongia mobilis]
MNSQTSTGAATDRLRPNVLGVAAITFFVVSAAAPLTAVAGGYPIAMLLGNGIGVPLSVLAVTAILLIFSVGYTTMARHISNAGSFYAFTGRGLGSAAGGAAAYIAVLAYNAMQTGLYGLFGAVAAGVMGEFGIAFPWWLWAVGCWALVGIFGYLKIDLSAKVLAVLVAAEYVIVVILDFAILGQGGASGINTVSFTSDAFLSGEPIIGMLLCFAAFMGFEATTIYSEEARDPVKTVPRATYLAVLLIGVFYAFTTWCMVLGAGADQLMPTLGGLEDPTIFLFILSDQFLPFAGGIIGKIMSLLLITSVFAALLAFHNAAARYFYVLGREGLLPAGLGRTHDEHQSPHIGSLLQTALGIVILAIFAGTGQDPILALFVWLTNLATLSVIVLMGLVSFAVIAFFGRRPELGVSAFKGVLAPLLAGVLLITIAYLVLTHFEVLTGASPALSIGIPILVPVFGIVGALVAYQLKKSGSSRFSQFGANKG